MQQKTTQPRKTKAGQMMNERNKKEFRLQEAEKAEKEKERQRNIELYKKAMGIRTEKEKTCEQ